MSLPLPVTRLSRLTIDTTAQPWLIEGVWAEKAVGFIGGAPKSFKTFLALHLAVAVASGSHFLGRFPVHGPGPVLLVAAEDEPVSIRDRVASIASASNLDFDKLLVGLVTAPGLLLDRPDHQDRIEATLKKIRPRILILDPFVRLHNQNENDAARISALLSFLRLLNRRYNVAIAIVHHVRKMESASPGMALRGSGDLYAWADSCLYLLPHGPSSRALYAEHRAQPGHRPLLITLQGDPPHLSVSDFPEPTQPAAFAELAPRILEALRERPATGNVLRTRLGIRNETLGQALNALRSSGQVYHTDRGWSLAVPSR